MKIMYCFTGLVLLLYTQKLFSPLILFRSGCDSGEFDLHGDVFQAHSHLIIFTC